MYRFNGVDRRLERSMEAVCMVMEAFENYEEKFKVTARAGHLELHWSLRVSTGKGCRLHPELPAGTVLSQLLHLF